LFAFKPYPWRLPEGQQQKRLEQHQKGFNYEMRELRESA
jgi:hypothetical protein